MLTTGIWTIWHTLLPTLKMLSARQLTGLAGIMVYILYSDPGLMILSGKCMFIHQKHHLLNMTQHQ